jgi:hypothetical protein
MYSITWILILQNPVKCCKIKQIRYLNSVCKVRNAHMKISIKQKYHRQQDKIMYEQTVELLARTSSFEAF